MSENEDNVKDFRIRCINTLLHYYIKNKNNNKRITDTVSLRINPYVYRDFVNALYRFGLPKYANIGLMTEALMRFFIKLVGDQPRIVQATLFYKPHIEKVEVKQQVNIAQRLELKLVKQDLTTILNGLERKRGDQNFLLGRLREVLPKAVRLYQKTSNAEIAVLLEKAEKYV